ncbi:acetylglutamate semialdehyde dehydrogenase [Bacillus cabrialesii]|uniref:acetylglutamate semialdehyde dehydrogenase n=1 Tax=Bacillus cabrialesii TaxID=2487276 RepID=UPI000CDAFAFA|nr:acetylglutamate semialdehyde dehydrogenase [Bacillus cabrialesii]AUZ25983.1 acetylglutamate semialdehyde dehydrogenase [Bacillus cereus]MBU2660184.1 acetylglutamate semialdehyde dehydrogenase [Bacillus cabrialesii]POO75288.1 acetylglutamate semialdehyde dehydrogenase [Bacillus subtilis]
MNKGFSAKDYLLNVLESKEKIFKAITEFKGEEKIAYQEKLSQFKNLHQPKVKANKREKGKALEELVTFLFNTTSIFKVLENIHTSTNEIDVIMTLNSKGRRFLSEGFLDNKFDIFLAECKNYNKTIGVTWVGKFWSLLNSSPTKLGIIFSYHGLSGRKWADGIGLTKKIYMSKERIEDKICIIDFNIKDFEQIAEGHSILDIISSKIQALMLDVDDYKKFLTKHPSQE